MVARKLFCASVGVAGDAFDVEVDGHAFIDTLKETILKRSPIKIQYDTKDLKLFLAKKGDAWLRYNDPAVLELKEGKIHEDIQKLIDGEKMEPTRTLEDVLIANNMTKRKRRAPTFGQIHILVVVLEGGHRSANRNLTNEEMLKEIYAGMVLGKRQFSHLQVDSSEWMDITNELNITVAFVDTIDAVDAAAGEGASIGPFD